MLLTQTTVRSGLRIRSISVEVTSDFFHGSSFVRSTMVIFGQAARSRVNGGWTTPDSPAAVTTAVSEGAGEISRCGTPLRRHRSTRTSRACQVGARSSCSASSCSSMTTADAISGHGAHAADLGPITTSTPPIAAAQSSGIRATDTLDRRSRVARIRASLIVGVTTSVGPWAMAERRAGSTSLRGGNRSTPPTSGQQLGRRWRRWRRWRDNGSRTPRRWQRRDRPRRRRRNEKWPRTSGCPADRCPLG